MTGISRRSYVWRRAAGALGWLLLLAAPVPVAALATELATLPASAVRFPVDAQALARAPVALSIALPGQRVLDFEVRAVRPAPGLTGLTGRTATGDRLTLFVAHGRILGGDILARGGAFRLVNAGRVQAWVPVRDLPSRTPAGFRWLPDSSMPAPAPRAPGIARVAAPKNDGRYEIDLLITYTPLFEERTGGRQGAIAQALYLTFLANTYFENSGIPAVYRVLAVEKYTGVQEQTGGYRARWVLGHEPVLRAYRDRIGADLVVHLRTMDGAADVALATPFNGQDRSDPPLDVDGDRDAYAVVFGAPSAEGAYLGDFVFAHELGHTLGGGHDWIAHQADGLNWREYAHGWQCGDAGGGQQYATVMAYGALAANDPVGHGLAEPRGDIFSSPNLVLHGTPCGSAGVSGVEATQADNVRAITAAAPYVAAYREPRVAPVTP